MTEIDVTQAPQANVTDAASTIAADLLITNKRGLHARASAKFVQLVEEFDAEIEVSKDNHTVGGTSIMGLMMLAASPGTTIHVVARGRQATEALAAICDLVNAKFNEE
jgi:phosphocarrier protein